MPRLRRIIRLLRARLAGRKLSRSVAAYERAADELDIVVREVLQR